MTDTSSPVLTGVAVHWHDEAGIEDLAASWPRDSRFELIVVDNGSRRTPFLPNARLLRSARNLGFAGGANLGVQAASSELVLILNSDIILQSAALERLVEGFELHPEAAGLAPRLTDRRGACQHRWQLRPLPSLGSLLLQSLLIPVGDGPPLEPEPGTPVEQPAAAALALRRRALEELAGFDEAFYPAWFEDVDLAARLQQAGHTVLYWPDAEFRHGLGTTIQELGFRRFLWIYHANLGHYLRKHHGAPWAFVARCLLVPACLLRILLLPARKPRRAPDRLTAARGLIELMAGALTGWRRKRPDPTTESSTERGEEAVR